MKTKEQIIILTIAAIVIAFVIGAYQLKVYFFGAAEQGKETISTEFYASLPSDSCTFYSELVSIGFSKDEALYNITCCKDDKCPYHHNRKTRQEEKKRIERKASPPIF
ncbi:MAG: hypothetical protein WCU80_07640 [Paludibacteraceae bacterium]